MTTKNLLGIMLSVTVLIFLTADSHAEPTMNDFTAYPPFMTVAPKPNVLILMDNSGSMLSYAYDFNDAGVSTPIQTAVSSRPQTSRPGQRSRANGMGIS